MNNAYIFIGVILWLIILLAWLVMLLIEEKQKARKRVETPFIPPLMVVKRYESEIDTLKFKKIIPRQDVYPNCEYDDEFLDEFVIKDFAKELIPQLHRYINIETEYDPRYMQYAVFAKLRIARKES